MPRLDGDVFLFGTAMTAYSWCPVLCDCRPELAQQPALRNDGSWAYRRTARATLGGPNTGSARRECGGAARIKRRQTGHQRTGMPGAALDRVGQDRGHLGGLDGAKLARRNAEGPARPGLGAELAVRPPFGDVEVDFEDSAF